MTDPTGSTVHELLAQILARYGSIEVFIARLHVLLDAPTVVLLAATAPSASGRHRHRLAEPTGTVPSTTPVRDPEWAKAKASSAIRRGLLA
ncbi:hypothetical protein ACQP1O_17320 [Nocardia sp. CA-151230]|uniref:hypothetical protein n=1 Tax=Nocardia sp. CA-151230 TaxID=3239982 RepID=UPI003D89F4D5